MSTWEPVVGEKCLVKGFSEQDSRAAVVLAIISKQAWVLFEDRSSDIFHFSDLKYKASDYDKLIGEMALVMSRSTTIRTNGTERNIPFQCCIDMAKALCERDYVVGTPNISQD